MPRSEQAIRDGLNACEHWLKSATSATVQEARLDMQAYFRKKVASLRQENIEGRFNSYELSECKQALSFLNSASATPPPAPCDAQKGPPSSSTSGHKENAQKPSSRKK